MGNRSDVFLTLAQVGSERQVSSPSHFIPSERAPSTQWIGGWVGPKDSLHDMGK
jgi:hypothetical protein